VEVIPEDRANERIVNGFLNHFATVARTIEVRPPAGGWPRVLEVFEQEYIGILGRKRTCYVVLLIDFDKDRDRRAKFEAAIPENFKPRVFVIGSNENPEAVCRDLRISLEEIGEKLAEDCFRCGFAQCDNSLHLNNQHELLRMIQAIGPIVFPGGWTFVPPAAD